MSSDIPDKITPSHRSVPSKPVEPSIGEQQEPGEAFSSYMKEGPEGTSPTRPDQPSPFDLAGGRGGIGTQPPTLESILEQTSATSDHLDTIQTHLSDKNLKLKQSQKYLLNNKLSEANSQLRKVSTQVGVEVPELPPTRGRRSPVAKYLGLIQDSQNNVNQVAKTLASMKDKGENLSPGDLLLAQSQLAKGNNELEYASVLLSTATSDIKNIFSIQI